MSGRIIRKARDALCRNLQLLAGAECFIAKRILTDSRNQADICSLPYCVRREIKRRAANLFFLFKDIPEDFSENDQFHFISG